MEVFIKLNKQGYFYIVGYTHNSEGEFSYLLDLNDTKGKRRFIFFVNADEMNKWISLGKFKISAPFGIESLQVIASDKDLLSNLPKYKFDTKMEYYIISRDNKNAVVQTRALKRPRKKNKKQKFAEAVLMFTTIRKNE